MCATGALTAITPSAASAEPCTSAANWRYATSTCGASGTAALPAPKSDVELTLFLPRCLVRVQLACAEALGCITPSGGPGVRYRVTVDGEDRGEWCVGDDNASANTPTPGNVLTAMRRLDWPAGELVIEPPDATTLVNFDTNFYTTSTDPVTRRVTLLGQQVTIEATPTTFTWRFDDGVNRTTTDPGAAYPDLRITHNYLRVGAYQPSLDLTYAGRYRIGGGPWQEIPGTHTVAGTAQPLRVIEATPKLVSP